MKLFLKVFGIAMAILTALVGMGAVVVYAFSCHVVLGIVSLMIGLAIIIAATVTAADRAFL